MFRHGAGPPQIGHGVLQPNDALVVGYRYGVNRGLHGGALLLLAVTNEDALMDIRVNTIIAKLYIND